MSDGSKQKGRESGNDRRKKVWLIEEDVRMMLWVITQFFLDSDKGKGNQNGFGAIKAGYIN